MGAGGGRSRSKLGCTAFDSDAKTPVSLQGYRLRIFTIKECNEVLIELNEVLNGMEWSIKWNFKKVLNEMEYKIELNSVGDMKWNHLES